MKFVNLPHVPKVCSSFILKAAVLPVVVTTVLLMAPTQGREAQAESENLNPQSPVCVFGWSKDTCKGGIEGDNVRDAGCIREIDGEIIECKTVYVQDATWKFAVTSNPNGCDDASRCDETKHLNGTIVLKGDFTFRKNGSCPFRGCWEGDWDLYDTSGNVVASGRGHGTLGTGSHRAPTCIGPINQQCNPNCERCYDVQFVPSVDPPIAGTWYVGLEGCLEGEVFAGPFQSSEICITVSGTLSGAGSYAEPDNFGKWRYCGTSDGVVLSKCS